MNSEYFKYFKYIVSGGSAAVVNIGSLYLLTDFAHVYYVISSIAAFLLSVAVSFLLQKFWTFQNKASAGVGRQAALFFAVSLINLALNTGLIYGLVEYMHLWYVAAAFFAGLLIAFASFFVYRGFIFTASHHDAI